MVHRGVVWGHLLRHLPAGQTGRSVGAAVMCRPTEPILESPRRRVPRRPRAIAQKGRSHHPLHFTTVNARHTSTAPWARQTGVCRQVLAFHGAGHKKTSMLRMLQFPENPKDHLHSQMPRLKSCLLSTGCSTSRHSQIMIGRLASTGT